MSLLRDAIDFFSNADNWSGPRGIWSRTGAHLWISFVSLLIAMALAAPLALWLGHRRKWPVLSVAIANIGRAVPSFAIIVLVFPLSLALGFGLGFWPTAVALVALGIPPIFTNSYTGITAVSADAVDAARGMGMTNREVLRRVEVPGALPLMLNGIRVAAVQIVATATLGALVGYECLGSFIIQGLAQPNLARDKLIGGAILVAVVSVLADAFFGYTERALAPWRVSRGRDR